MEKPNHPKLEDCVLVDVPPGYKVANTLCNLCVRVRDRSGLYGPDCRNDGWECGYKESNGDEWLMHPRVWMTKLDAVVFRLTGEANVKA